MIELGARTPLKKGRYYCPTYKNNDEFLTYYVRLRPQSIKVNLLAAMTGVRYMSQKLTKLNQGILSKMMVTFAFCKGLVP